MAESPQETSAALKDRVARFRRGESGLKMIRCPVSHAPGFCFCDTRLIRSLCFYLQAGIALFILKLPFNAPKLWVLRKLGAKIGRNVHIAVDVWIDPLFPDLLEIEDDVTIGVGARIAFHECTVDEFVIGRVTIRKGAVIGGFSLIAPGVEIGPRATVAGGAVVGSDVPAGATAIGNPARVRRATRASMENNA